MHIDVTMHRANCRSLLRTLAKTPTKNKRSDLQLISIVRYVTWETPAADTLLSSLRPKTADNEDGDDGDDDIDADGDDDDDDDDGAPLWTQPYYKTSKNHISKRRRAR